MPATRPSPPTPALVSALHAALTQEVALMSAFIAVLEHEANVLSGGAETEALAAVSSEKSGYADKLRQAGNQRNGLLAALGYAHDKTGLDAAAQAHDTVADKARQLLSLSEQGRVLNSANGGLITQFMQHNQAALDTLQHLTGRSKLYDARGRTRATAAPRPTHVKAG